MVYRKSKLKSIVSEYIRLVKAKVPVEKVILFGSYAYGRPTSHSDIDLAIISSKFKKMEDVERIMLLSDISRKVNTSKDVCIEPLGFTMEELNNADYFDIASEIRDKGVAIS
jgi:predicted nucleotidyltransferase